MQIFTACKAVSYSVVHSVFPSVMTEQEVTSSITKDVFLTHYLEKGDILHKILLKKLNHLVKAKAVAQQYVYRQVLNSEPCILDKNRIRKCMYMRREWRQNEEDVNSQTQSSRSLAQHQPHNPLHIFQDILTTGIKLCLAT